MAWILQHYNIPDPVKTGQLIKQARKERRIKQKDLAALLGVAAGTLQQWEYGKRTPNNANVNALIKALGVSCEDLNIRDVGTRLDASLLFDQSELAERMHQIASRETAPLASTIVQSLDNDQLPAAPETEETADPALEKILALYKSFNSEGKLELLRYAELLSEHPKYKKKAIRAVFRQQNQTEQE